MTDQGEFDFDAVPTEAHARTSDPVTSHAAAAWLDEDTLRESQRAVLGAFGVRAQMTDTDLIRFYLQDRMRRGWPSQSTSGLRTRRRELVDGKLLRDSGRKVVLESGRKSIVWEKTRPSLSV